MGDRTYAFDANLLLADGASAMTAAGAATVGGAAATLDLGGNQTQTPVLQARMDATLIIYVMAIVTANTNNIYRATLQGSNDPSFLTTATQNLAEMTFGNVTAKETALGTGGTGLTTPTPLGSGLFGQVPADSMYELPFTTEQNNVKYQYLRLWVSVAGTSGSITLLAFVSEQAQH